MAGVYIKGARLPDACWNCGWDPCMLWNEDRGDLPKHPNCPLMEVPDHGDLIDANTMIGVELYDECREEWYEEAMTVWEYLGYASTANVQIVIPAEKSKNEQQRCSQAVEKAISYFNIHSVDGKEKA